MSLSLGLGITSSTLTGAGPAGPGISGLETGLFGPVPIDSACDSPPVSISVFVGHYLLRPNCFNVNNIVRQTSHEDSLAICFRVGCSLADSCGLLPGDTR